MPSTVRRRNPGSSSFPEMSNSFVSARFQSAFAIFFGPKLSRTAASVPFVGAEPSVCATFTWNDAVSPHL